MDSFLLALAWATFYGLHSILASTPIKKKLNLSQRNYRLCYNAVALTSLSAVLWVHFGLASPTIFTRTIATDIIGFGLIVGGLWVHFLTFQQLSIHAFLGILPEVQGDLVAKGIYAYLRHPIYLGILLIMLGLMLLQPITSNLISLLVTLLYLPFGIRFEEQKLIAEFGDTYQQYCKKVPSLFPRLSKFAHSQKSDKN